MNDGWELTLVCFAMSATFVFGYISGLWRAGHQKSSPPREIEPPKPVCGCGHHYAVHGDDGVCTSITQGVVSREPKVLKVGYAGEDHEVHYVEKFEQIPCPCKRYTGPEPLPSYYS